jgi:hypothetical protein
VTISIGAARTWRRRGHRSVGERVRGRSARRRGGWRRIGLMCPSCRQRDGVDDGSHDKGQHNDERNHKGHFGQHSTSPDAPR